MKHKWKITRRGKKSKYYDCERCDEHMVADSLKQAYEFSDNCVQQVAFR